MLVFVNSPVPLDLFQKPSLHSSIVKSLSDKEKFFSMIFHPMTTRQEKIWLTNALHLCVQSWKKA